MAGGAVGPLLYSAQMWRKRQQGSRQLTGTRIMFLPISASLAVVTGVTVSCLYMEATITYQLPFLSRKVLVEGITVV